MLEVWDELRALERRFDDVARSFLGPRSWITFPSLPSGLRRPFIPATDVFARGGDIVVRAELPGIDPDKDVRITLGEDEVVVRGERKRTEEIKEEDYFRAETSYGAFERHIPVPAGTREKDVDATYGDGILEVRIKGAAKVEPPRAKAIHVRSEKPRKVKVA